MLRRAASLTPSARETEQSEVKVWIYLAASRPWSPQYSTTWFQYKPCTCQVPSLAAGT